MLTVRGLHEVLGSLAEIGYNAEWQDIRAEDMGAPHRRERIWIVAYPDREPGAFRRNDKTDEAKSRRGSNNKRGRGKNDWGKFDTEENAEMENSRHLSRRNKKSKAISKSKENRMQCDTAAGPGEVGTIPDSTSIGRTTGRSDERQHENNISEIGKAKEDKQSGNIGKCRSEQIRTDSGEMADTEGKRIQGGRAFRKQKSKTHERERISMCGGSVQRAVYWTTEPDVGRLAHGVPNRVDRLKGLGNAIVPQIAAVLFNLIKESL